MNILTLIKWKLLDKMGVIQTYGIERTENVRINWHTYKNTKEYIDFGLAINMAYHYIALTEVMCNKQGFIYHVNKIGTYIKYKKNKYTNTICKVKTKYVRKEDFFKG